MTRCAWFHPFSGIAGDMAMGSLIDAGADLDEVRAMIDVLGLPGWELTCEDVLRGGIGGTKAHVAFTPSTVVRTATAIDALLAQAALPPRVRDRARIVFAALSAAEGRLHRVAPARVHFHEVGSLDAIIDIVGTCAALEVLDVAVVSSATVTTGTGMVRAAHGIIPNPSPATVELLRDAPTRGVDEPVELTTPTGAAILAALVDDWGPLPPMQIIAQGFGAGTRELAHRPNLTQVVIGERSLGRLDSGQPVMLLETNVDDVTGEVLSYTIEMLLENGALDAWLTPVVMKKGRPGYVIHVLADFAQAENLRETLVAQTGSLGVRGQWLDRWPQARRFDDVATESGPASIKVSAQRAKVEFADAARIAKERRAPLREVQAELEAAWRNGQDAGTEDAHGHRHGHGHGLGHGLGHDHEQQKSHWHEEGPSDPVA